MIARISLSLCWIIALAGCSADQPSAASPSNTAGGASGAKPDEPEIPLTLAPVGIPVPPLDGGRFKTSLPDGWRLLPRRSEYLLGAYENQPSGIPRILVHVSDTSLGDVVDDASGKILYKTLAEEIGELTFAYPPPKVIEVGSNFYVQYVRPAKFQGENARQLVLETVRNGRRYKLELFVAKNDLAGKASALYRLANDVQYGGGEAESPAASPAEEKAEEPSGDDKS